MVYKYSYFGSFVKAAVHYMSVANIKVAFVEIRLGVVKQTRSVVP